MSGLHEHGTSSRPPGLAVAAALVVLEAVAAVVLAVLSLVASPLGGAVTSGIAVAVFVLVFAVLLALAGVGLWRRRTWSRTATLVWQVIQLLVGLYALQGDGANVAFAVLAIVPAAAVIVLLFTRPVRDATVRG